MIQNLKVTDGDMLVVSFSGNVSHVFIEKVTKRLEAWLAKKGLTNVEILVTSVEGGFSINKISVNDVFEEELLKGAKNG